MARTILEAFAKVTELRSRNSKIAHTPKIPAASLGIVPDKPRPKSITPWREFMTIHERIIYGRLSGAVSLRQEIVARATRAFDGAQRLRLMIVVTATIVGVIQIAAYVELLSASAWINSHGYYLSLSSITATLFASAHVWYCRQRLEISNESLAEFVRHLPVAASVGNLRYARNAQSAACDGAL